MLYQMSDRYLQIEVDEFGHPDRACYEEDARLEIIAADVGLPGLVLRVNPDHPPCFRRRRLSNGVPVEVKIDETFDSLLGELATVVSAFLIAPAPDKVERRFLCAA